MLLIAQCLCCILVPWHGQGHGVADAADDEFPWKPAPRAQACSSMLGPLQSPLQPPATDTSMNGLTRLFAQKSSRNGTALTQTFAGLAEAAFSDVQKDTSLFFSLLDSQSEEEKGRCHTLHSPSHHPIHSYHTQIPEHPRTITDKSKTKISAQARNSQTSLWTREKGKSWVYTYPGQCRC